MRVIGYVREMPGPENGNTAYVQSETIRRWVSDHGYQLVSVCHDSTVGEHDVPRAGFGALLEVVSSQLADLVVLPALEVLSADKVTQEIMVWELRRLGTAVASVAQNEATQLAEVTPDPARRFIRDTLVKVDRYRDAYRPDAGRLASAPANDPIGVDVVVEIVEREDLAVRSLSRSHDLHQASA